MTTFVLFLMLGYVLPAVVILILLRRHDGYLDFMDFVIATVPVANLALLVMYSVFTFNRWWRKKVWK